MGDALDAVELGEFGDEEQFADAAAQAGVGLDDVDGAPVQEFLECLSVEEHLAAGDREVELRGQFRMSFRRQPALARYAPGDGKNTALWPGLSAGYWLAMRRAEIADYAPTTEVDAGSGGAA